MKILLINKFFYPRGGAETVFFQEREFLKQAGFSVSEFAMQHPDNLKSDYGDYFVPQIEYRHDEGPDNRRPNYLEKLWLAGNFVYSRRATTRLERLIRRERPDIAHLHNIYHQISPAIIPLLKKLGIKVVLTLHDYKLICPVYHMVRHDRICCKCRGKNFWHVINGRCEAYSWSRSLLLAVEAYWHYWTRSYEHVDLFLAPSRFMAQQMVSYRLRRDKVKILRNGVDCQDWAPSGEEGDYALFVGRISQEKGVETFLESCRLLGWPLPVKIVGEGPQLSRYRKQFPQAEFTGFKNSRELEDIYRRAAFVVVPSEWYENCSMVVLEAMVYGKPVIGSRIGGIPEQIDDGVSGLLFTAGDQRELAEKITLLITNASIRRQLGVQARKKLEKEYALEAHCRQLLSIYKDLLSVS